MVTNSPSDEVKFLEAQIREIYAKVVWTQKIHEESANIKFKRHKKLKVLQIILSALTTTSIIASFFSVFGETKAGEIIAAILSAIIFGIDVYTKDYDLGKESQSHVTTAAKLLKVREDYLSLLTDMKTGGMVIQDIKNRRDQLQKELMEIYNNSPRSNEAAVNQARKALKVNYDHTFTDEEIDIFLPKELKKLLPK